jgi:hypothetical protein
MEVVLEDIRSTHIPEDLDQHSGADGLLEIIFEGEGLVAVEVIRLARGEAVRAIVACAASKGGFPFEEALLFIEDEPQSVALETIVSDEYPHRRKHHVHRTRSIEVIVHYMSRSAHRQYPPSARVETVLAWALREFSIDPAIAPEFELALAGSTDELPGSRHIGGLIRHPCGRVEMNLIRGVIPNGAGS